MGVGRDLGRGVFHSGDFNDQKFRPFHIHIVLTTKYTRMPSNNILRAQIQILQRQGMHCDWKRAAAAALQKPSRTEESNNTVCRDSTQMQLLYRRSIKQNWLTESIEQNTKQKKFGS